MAGDYSHLAGSMLQPLCAAADSGLSRQYSALRYTSRLPVLDDLR